MRERMLPYLLEVGGCLRNRGGAEVVVCGCNSGGEV